MDILLDDAEVRILGCLIEKELTTPEYYPLSLKQPDERLQPEIQPQPYCFL